MEPARNAPARLRRPAATAAATLALALFSVLLPALFATAAVAEDDETFLRSLDDTSRAVDVRRLSRLYFGAASALEAGRGSAGLLLERVLARDPGATTVQATLTGRFEDYRERVVDFRASVDALLDEPESRAALYRASTDGLRTCWQLDRYIRAAEAYGASGGDLLGVLTSREVCESFRRAALHPRVEERVRRALFEADEARREADDLREELAELERLLDDLAAIDAREP